MKAFSPIFAGIILSCSSAFAQLVQNDIGTHSMILKYNDVSKMGGNKVSKTYDNVHGRYLWDKDWHRGVILMKPGNVIKLKEMKLNFYTQEIQYPVNGDEMAASIENMKTIILYQNGPGDTTAIAATFEVIRNLEKRNEVGLATTKDFFYEVMNRGKIQLLKRTIVGANKMRTDPIIDTEMIYFYPTNDYLIRTATAIKSPKNLSKSNIFDALPEAVPQSGWLSANKNKLKTEEDVVAFFNHLNSLEP